MLIADVLDNDRSLTLLGEAERGTTTVLSFHRTMSNTEGTAPSAAPSKDASQPEKDGAGTGADVPAHPGGQDDGDVNSEEFKLENLHKYFSECLQEDGGLLIDSYVLGYGEIYKFLCLLGTVFGWVAADIHQKNIVLRAHREGENAEAYRTVQTMIRHEEETKLVKVNAKHQKCTSGARNLLRLHRALAYIIAFLECLPEMPDEEKCCPHSQAAYKKTLAKHHPWVVQKAALLAMNMLPTKQGLIKKTCGEDEVAYKEAARMLPEAIKAMKVVYDKTHQIYEERKLLDIP